MKVEFLNESFPVTILKKSDFPSEFDLIDFCKELPGCEGVRPDLLVKKITTAFSYYIPPIRFVVGNRWAAIGGVEQRTYRLIAQDFVLLYVASGGIRRSECWYEWDVITHENVEDTMENRKTLQRNVDIAMRLVSRAKSPQDALSVFERMNDGKTQWRPK